MKTQFKAAVLLGLVLITAAPALAGDGIFGKASSNSRSKSSPRRSLMDVLMGTEERPAVDSSMNRGARWDSSAPAPAAPSSSFLTRTKDFFMPWSKSEPATVSPTGTRRVYQGKTPPEMETQSSSRGPIARLFGFGEEPKKVETVNDFLGQSRPGDR
ncbi:MAG: hypothetical protein RIC55_14650 [Pirellulaceae bacterium]